MALITARSPAMSRASPVGRWSLCRISDRARKTHRNPTAAARPNPSCLGAKPADQQVDDRCTLFLPHRIGPAPVYLSMTREMHWVFYRDDDGACDALPMRVAGRSRVDARPLSSSTDRAPPRILLRQLSLPDRCLATPENASRWIQSQL